MSSLLGPSILQKICIVITRLDSLNDSNRVRWTQKYKNDLVNFLRMKLPQLPDIPLLISDSKDPNSFNEILAHIKKSLSDSKSYYHPTFKRLQNSFDEVRIPELQNILRER